MNAIEIKKLTKKYKDVTAVDGLELSVGRASCLLCSASTEQEKLRR